MRHSILSGICSILCIIFFSPCGLDAKTYYVAANGNSTNDGSSFTSALDLTTALSKVVSGDTALLRAETYTISYKANQTNTIALTKSGASGKPISVFAEQGKRAVIDFSFPSKTYVQDSYGIHLTGSYWYFKGIGITRAGYQGVYVEGAHNTFENCAFYDNRNTGLEINKGGSYTTLINCDAYRNFDPKKNGSMADGFGPKQTQGAGNTFIGCRSWENSDDGYDCFDSPEIVTFQNCWAFRNGVNVFGASPFEGNGNGFKVGGNMKVANNKLSNCVAFGQPKKGFDQNNNKGGLTIYNCLAYKNGTNYGLGNDVDQGQKHILKNNVSLDTISTIANATESNNTWNTGFSVSDNDFESLDTSLARVPRNPDGSLPVNKLFRLKKGSALIDAGVNVGLPYKDKAPDIGCFEFDNGTSLGNNLKHSSFSCFPMLTFHGLTMRFTGQASMVSVRLYTISGKVILSSVFKATGRDLFTIYFSEGKMVPGIYLCSVEGYGNNTGKEIYSLVYSGK